MADQTERDALAEAIIGRYPSFDPLSANGIADAVLAAGFHRTPTPHVVTTDAPVTATESPNTSTVVDAVRYFAESWRFKGGGQPNNTPDQYDEALDWCSQTLFAMLDRLTDDKPLGAECINTGWVITAAICPDCKGSGRADSMKGAQECLPCGGCGHVCDDSARTPATVLTPAPAPVDREALVEKVARVWLDACGIDPDFEGDDTGETLWQMRAHAASAVLDAIEGVSRG